MAKLSRRSVIGGVGALASPAMASPITASSQPGAQAWDVAPTPAPLPLDAHVNTGNGVRTLREWFDGRPTVLALWATWCGPCLAEKRPQADMARRLEAAGARTRIALLQIYDDVNLTQGRHVLRVLGASSLMNGEAQRDAERAFMDLLGGSTTGQPRTSLPWHILIGADGTELGRTLGLMRGTGGEYNYFEDDATFEFLRAL